MPFKMRFDLWLPYVETGFQLRNELSFRCLVRKYCTLCRVLQPSSLRVAVQLAFFVLFNLLFVKMISLFYWDTLHFSCLVICFNEMSSVHCLLVNRLEIPWWGDEFSTFRNKSHTIVLFHCWVWLWISHLNVVFSFHFVVVIKTL